MKTATMINSVSMPENERKPRSKGRQKIEIKKVEAHNKRHVTFSKRKQGIFNKAAELSILTGAEIAVMAFSQCGKVFPFGSPGYNAVIEKYLGQGRVYLQPLTNNINDGDDHDHDHEPLSSVTWHASKVQYLDAMKLLEEEETRCGEMMIKRENEAAGSSSSSNSNSSNVGFWWDCSIENMDLEELKQLLVSLQKLKDKVEKKAGHIQIISKPSSSSSSSFLSLLSNDDYYFNGVGADLVVLDTSSS